MSTAKILEKLPQDFIIGFLNGYFRDHFPEHNMDGQGDGWHNGPNSFRMPIPRGLRPPNDEPNMEFIAILDFIVNQEIIFVNQPEQWDLGNNNDNDNPNNVNMEHNNVVIEDIVDNPGDEAPLDDAVGAEVRTEGNPPLEEIEPLSEQSRSQSRAEEDEITSSECTRLPILDFDDANPQPGPSRKRSEDGDDERFFQQNSSESSTDSDVFEAKLLLGRCKKHLRNDLVAQEEEGVMDFSEIPKSVSNSDKAEEGSDCEERLKDLITQEAEQDSPIRTKSEGQHFQWWPGCDDNSSENSANLEGPEEVSASGGSICQRDDLHSEKFKTTLRLNKVSINPECNCSSSYKAETDGLSEGPDEDPLPGPSRLSRTDAGHQFDMTSSNRLQWWRQFGGNSSDSSTDLEDSQQVFQTIPSRKRAVDDDKEEDGMRSNKRFRVTFWHDCNSDSGTDAEDCNGSRNVVDPFDTKGKKRLKWRDEFPGKHKCGNSSSHGIENGSHESTVGLSDQDADDAPLHAPSKDSSWQLQKRSLKSSQVGHEYDNSSDSADSGQEEPHKLSLRDNLARLSLSDQRTIVNFQEGRTQKKSSSNLEAEEGSPPTQTTENLSEEEETSGKK
uniref:uncharacterized protein LOC131110016 n=1 Tax=Doryrhamphus excisus TaxID=161450 RepID=UPI0025AE3E1A|nr:uncharacterized protein LOC131110016 [Doryrhamphus excisus]